MKASLARAIAAKVAAAPILTEIQQIAKQGKFYLYVTCPKMPTQVKEHLINLGYRVEPGGSGLGDYVMW